MKAMGYYENRGAKDRCDAEGGTSGKDVIYQDLTYTPNRVDKGIVTFRRFQMHRIGMVVRFFNFSIALFTVLFIAIVGLLIFSAFFSPRLWLSNGC